MNILDDLEWRGLVADCTAHDELRKRLAHERLALYCGFDPTADSLHVGHLVPLIALRRFQNAGHIPIAVAGGATGAVGDPSGKSAERNLLSPEQIRANVEAVKPQLARLLDFRIEPNTARLLDNAEWTNGLTFIEFLRDVGKHFTVNQMIAKESVRARMEDRETGISFTEFSYMLLQAHDFYVLARDHECALQIGGSDQWGNITLGIDLVRKKLGKPSFGLTLPLVVKSDGTKFGKTESGAVWLDPKKTSPYKFYQFWINTDDRDVITYLKRFTFLGPDEIGELEEEHRADPGRRAPQRRLARVMTDMIHGGQAADEAARASEILFSGGPLDDISETLFTEVVGEAPTKRGDPARFAGEGVSVVELFVEAGLCSSKGQARKDLEGGGLYLNNVRLTEVRRAATGADLLFGKYLLLRKGRKQYVVIHVGNAT
jgi:tyrosyl-tRNA synthetase